MLIDLVKKNWRDLDKYYLLALKFDKNYCIELQTAINT